jgi:outer membrane protein assembly factor BamB
VESQPVVVENRVIFGSADGRVYALDTATGGQYWRYSTPDAVFAHPQVQGEIVYVASSGSTLSALDLLTGKRIWQAELPAPLRNPPAIAENAIYQLGEANPDLFLIDRQSGVLQSSFPTGDWTSAGPWLDGGRIFLMGKDGAILAFRQPR